MESWRGREGGGYIDGDGRAVERLWTGRGEGMAAEDNGIERAVALNNCNGQGGSLILAMPCHVKGDVRAGWIKNGSGGFIARQAGMLCQRRGGCSIDALFRLLVVLPAGLSPYRFDNWDLPAMRL